MKLNFSAGSCSIKKILIYSCDLRMRLKYSLELKHLVKEEVKNSHEFLKALFHCEILCQTR